jgi:uncharacterized protein YbaP (TraB family)
MVNLLAAAALAAASPAGAPAQPPREPAMFVVRAAFEQSDELVLETLLPEGPNAAQELSDSITTPKAPRSPSFLATTQMAISAGRSQGMQVGNGADTVLRHIAEVEGKPVEGLETLQFQINMFNRLPMGAEATPKPTEATRESADEPPMQSLSNTMTEMQSAWKRGDQGVFVNLLDQLRASSPDTYRLMFTERNARWADWIAARMQTPGTVFVAVGAGHLAGKDSVLVRLAEKGIASQRVY